MPTSHGVLVRAAEHINGITIGAALAVVRTMAVAITGIVAANGIIATIPREPPPCTYLDI